MYLQIHNCLTCPWLRFRGNPEGAAVEDWCRHPGKVQKSLPSIYQIPKTCPLVPAENIDDLIEELEPL